MQKTTRWCCENPAWTLLFIVLLSLGIKFILWRVDPMISRDASFYLHNILQLIGLFLRFHLQTICRLYLHHRIGSGRYFQAL